MTSPTTRRPRGQRERHARGGVDYYLQLYYREIRTDAAKTFSNLSHVKRLFFQFKFNLYTHTHTHTHREKRERNREVLKKTLWIIFILLSEFFLLKKITFYLVNWSFLFYIFIQRIGACARASKYWNSTICLCFSSSFCQLTLETWISMCYSCKVKRFLPRARFTAVSHPRPRSADLFNGASICQRD